MMNFQLKFSVPEGVLTCTHHDRFVFLGSCFAEEMAERVRKAGFHEVSNPFGVIFHPLPLAESLRAAVQSSEKVQACRRDDLWFSWDAASECYASSEPEIIGQIQAKRANLRAALQSASVLVLTFGTSWGYRHRETGQIVANCHKFPQQDFQKELAKIEEMEALWLSVLDEIQTAFPQLKIVITVSPVRHIKDGLVENNRSKARLIEMAHTCAQRERVYYFPAYEIVLDELRDYRFYAEDLVHPSDLALNYVWQAFSRFCLNEASLHLAREVEGFHKAFQHKSLHPDSASDRERIARQEAKFSAFMAAHPEICFYRQ